MTTRRRSLVGTGLLALTLCVLVSSSAGLFSQELPKPPAEKPAVEAAKGETHPPPMSPKDSSRVYVFLAWTWLTIGVLLYFLRLKIREADRVYRTGLFRAAEAGKEPPER